MTGVEDEQATRAARPTAGGAVYGFPDDANEAVRDLTAYLGRLRGGRAMPRRQDLRPEFLPPSAFSTLVFLNVEGDEGPPYAGPWRFRFRLVGNIIRDASGQSWTGRYLDETLVGRNAIEEFIAGYSAPLLARRPTVTPHRFRNFRDRNIYRSRRYLFPMSSDDRRIDALIGMLVIEEGVWRTPDQDND